MKRPEECDSSSPSDQLFAQQYKLINDFNFDKDTAVVFDDMLDRSVPFYREIQRLVVELTTDFVEDGSTIYDLGCSTGNTIMCLGQAIPADKKVRFVGVDNSPAMLENAQKKFDRADMPHEVNLCDSDLNERLQISNASVALMILTLQFIRPLRRDHLLSEIHAGLKQDGCLILVEKVLGEDSLFNRLFIKHYYELKKRQGYSDLEISQKREALENILIPYRVKENEQLLRRNGFSQVDVFFKWYNFCGIIACK